MRGYHVSFRRVRRGENQVSTWIVEKGFISILHSWSLNLYHLDTGSFPFFILDLWTCIVSHWYWSKGILYATKIGSFTCFWSSSITYLEKRRIGIQLTKSSKPWSIRPGSAPYQLGIFVRETPLRRPCALHQLEARHPIFQKLYGLIISF